MMIGVFMRIFVSVVLLLLLLFSMTIHLDETALKLHDETFNRAMISFGLAKGLNAIISLIQGTELSFTPVGVGLNFSIGEVLDPFNDMVERFSWVMLASSVSLGIQKLLLVLSSKMFLQIALIASVGLSLLLLWFKKASNYSFFIFSLKVFALLFLLRFGAILFIYSSSLLYTSVLQPEYTASSAVVENTKVKLEEIQNQSTMLVESKKSSGFFGDVRSKYDELTGSFNISKQLSAVQNNIEEASQNIIQLITVFIVQTILLPLLFLWFFVLLIKWIFLIKVVMDKITLLLNKKEVRI